MQLAEATASGDRCSIDTIDMTYHAFFNLFILLDYIFIIIFITLDFTILYVAADINAVLETNHIIKGTTVIQYLCISYNCGNWRLSNDSA